MAASGRRHILIPADGFPAAVGARDGYPRAGCFSSRIGFGRQSRAAVLSPPDLDRQLRPTATKNGSPPWQLIVPFLDRQISSDDSSLTSFIDSGMTDDRTDPAHDNHFDQRAGGDKRRRTICCESNLCWL